MVAIYIFLYSLMCYGLSSAIVYYSGPFDIFEKWRKTIAYNDKLLELFSCMFCLPTNIGMVLSILSIILSPYMPFTPFTIMFSGNYIMLPLIILFDGLYTGAIVSIIDAIITRIERNNDKQEKILLNE